MVRIHSGPFKDVVASQILVAFISSIVSVYVREFALCAVWIEGDSTIKHIISTFFLSLVLVGVSGAQETTETTTLEERLEHLVEKLEAKRIEYHIPGMSIAVVLDDETVLVYSFGEANIELGLPVTNDSLFSIGSVTKSFTSAAVALLVDDGVMDWDAPITDYLPEFVLPIDRGEEDATSSENPEVLISDLLSHKTGFTRMHFLATNNTLSPEETLRTAILAEPWREFRSEFLYNNVQYLASGYAAGKVAGSDWNTLVEQRLLSPIGMDNTYTSWHRAPKDQQPIVGYQWDEDEDEFETFTLRTIDNIGPAGAIVSTASDMAKWVRFHLGHGEIWGKQVISSEQHARLWKSHFEIAPGIGYGFGWMLHEREGVYVVEHGGNVQGGSAALAMYPNENLGFVLLMNVSASPLQQESISIVRASMLGDIGGGAVPSIDFIPYLGNFIANFGPFQDATFTVKDKGGALAVDVPGQMLYELKPPDEEGKWYFTFTDEIAVSFDRNDEDMVVGMRLYQSGMTFELQREGIEIAPEIPLVELERYLGEYYNEEQDATPRVVIQNNRLAVDVPGQMVFELYPPDDEGVWVCRVTDKVQLRFIDNDGQQITGFEFLEGDDALTFDRVADSTREVLPSVDSILAKYNLEDRGTALDALGCFKFDGKTQMKQSGVSGQVTVLVDTAGRFLSEMDCGKYGWVRFGVIDDAGMMDLSFVGPKELTANQLKYIKTGSPLAWVGNWRDEYANITLLKAEIIDNRDVWVLKLKNEDDPAKTITVDQETGDVLEVRSEQLIPEIGGSLPYILFYADFKMIGGVRMPMTMTQRNDMTGDSMSTFYTVETGVDVPDSLFRIEPRERPTPWIAVLQTG